MTLHMRTDHGAHTLQPSPQKSKKSKSNPQVQDTSDANLEKYANIAAFAKEHGVDAYPAGRGIGHQVLCEEG